MAQFPQLQPRQVPNRFEPMSTDLSLFEFQHEQWFGMTPEQVFEFFECPENLAKVTPPWLDFQQLTPPPVPMREGTLIDYTIRDMGLRWRWRTLITVYQSPVLFIDEQLKGPYSYWRHEHHFLPVDGGTLMLDVIHYALPNLLPAALARWLNTHHVRPRLNAIFTYREERFRQLFCKPTDQHPAPPLPARHSICQKQTV